MNTARHRIEQILEEIISAGAVGDDLVREFREWFFGDGHRKEKLDVFQTLLESNIRFEPNPGDEVHEAYKKMALKLGFGEDSKKENHIRKNRKLGRRIALRAAAVLIPVVVVLGLSFYIWRTPEPMEHIMADTEITVTVPEGEKKHTTLPDGSSVWINGGSELVYEDDFGKERSVKFSGEALFSINKADGKPFTVISRGVKVSVLGTVFNIVADPGGETTVVSLYEGSLKVDTPDAPIMLSEGQELEYNQLTGLATVTHISRTRPEWMRNIINYNMMTVANVLNSLGNIYGYEIKADAPRVSGNIITLRFEDETGLEEVLSIMAEMCGFNYRTHGKEVYITE